MRERRWTGGPERVEAGAMPPDDAPRPGEEELAEEAAEVEAAGEPAEGDGGEAAEADGGEAADASSERRAE